jgi:hypothetical protein
VVPVLGPNGLTPAPAVWTGFDGDKVVEDISQMLERRRSSMLRGATSRCWSTICRVIFKSIWQKLEHELLAARKSAA